MTGPAWVGLGLAVFASTALLDAVWVCCVTAVKDERPLIAGGWSAACCVLGLVGLLGIVQHSNWLAVPEVLGAAVGTTAAVWWKRRKRLAAG